MLITFLRSSLLTTSKLCSGRMFLEYGIGRRSANNESSLKGTNVHGIMEALALCKLAQQNGLTCFSSGDLGEWACSDFDPYEYFEKLYAKLDKENPGVYKSGSHDECLKLIRQALSYQNGLYNPLKADVVAVEYSFDFEIKKDWAAYKYETPEGLLEGYLRLKGTCDLIFKEDKDTLHLIDYKTSKSTQDWATGKEKTGETLKDDVQLKLYYYALAKEFPQYANIMITLYFIRLNKPLTVLFEREELPEIEEWIRKEYETLRDLEKPKFIDRSYQKWKCNFCQFSKDIEPGSTKTVCRYFQDKLKKDGFDETMKSEADYKILTSYGEGGGRGFKQ